MPGFGGDFMGYKAGTQRRGGTRTGKTPQVSTVTWVQAKGGKGGGALAQEQQNMQGCGGG